MKIALFSDVHANLPALLACLEAMQAKQPDMVFCLGDLVGYNTWPNEVINEIRGRNIPCIAGNYDAGIGINGNDCGCAYKTDTEKQMGSVSISYTNSIVGDDERNYLRNLPSHIRLEYKAGDIPFDILLVHGSPRKVNEYLFEDRDEKSLLRILEQANATILCFGHTHKPYHRILRSENGLHHAINTGSVGKPKDNNPDGCFVMLNINTAVSPADESFLEVEFIRFSYDVEKAAKAIENSILPNEYAEMLRKGI